MNRRPTRPALVLLGIGIVGAVMFWLGGAAMPSYFAAWLFWIGVPMGALPIVMGMEATGWTRSPLLPVLRAMLPLLPLGTLFALPLLGGLSDLFGHPGLPAWWTAPATVALRDGIVLIALSVLAVIFWIVPRAPRRVLARVGLLLSLLLGTALAIDVVLAPQPALGSSLAGLLLITGQMALAATLAGLIVAVGTAPGERLPSQTGLLMGLIVGFWFFVQFVQFLVVWLANLPDEAAWYLARLAGFGTAAISFAAIAALAAIVLLPSLLGRVPAAMATLSSMVVLALLGVTLLFVLPAFRGEIALGAADALAVIGVGGLLVGAMLLLLPTEARHDPA